MRPPRKIWPWLLILPLLAALALTQYSINEQNMVRDPKTGQPILNADKRPMTHYRPINTLLPRKGEGVMDRVSHLTPAVFLGLKSALADVLWVKADSYFHSGRYERIMPLCHLITWLDPKFLEVYIIGAWHMAYNFMDPRYIPAGVDFLEKGINNNPGESELRFEQGHMLFDKAQRFREAAERFREANRMGQKPAGKRHALAHALEKDGRIDEAIAAWDAFIREETAAGSWQMANVSQHNRDLTIWRREARKLLTKDPLNVALNYKWSVPKSRVLRIDGTTNLPELTKINLVVRDKNYDQLMKDNPWLGWQVSNLTLYSDNLTVKDGKFSTWYKTGNLVVDRLDLSSEPAKYPLTAKEYEVILTINPRVEPIVVQDRTGWDGEGITGPNVQNVGGVKIVRKMFVVSKEQLLKQAQVSQAGR